MDFFNNPVPKDVDLKRSQDIIENNILYEENNYNVTILLDLYYEKSKINQVVKNIKQWNNQVKPRIIYPFNFKIKPKDIKNNVAKFYFSKILDLKKFCSTKEKVIAVGRILYSIVGSDDLDLFGFYDYIFNKTYFYDPHNQIYVYPTDSLKTFFSKGFLKDNWERYFFHLQVKKSFLEKDTFYKNQRIKKVFFKTKEEVDSFLEEWKDKNVLMACDIETKYLDPWNSESEILEVTISFDGKVGYLLPGSLVDKTLFSKFIKDKKLIMHNGKYDTKFFILRWGIPRESIYIYHDTWAGSHQINEMQKNSLKSDAWLYTVYGGYDRELDEYIEKYSECKKDFSKIPTKIRYPYAIMDAIITFQIYEKQLEVFQQIDEKLKKDNKLNDRWNTFRYFYEIRMLSVNTFLDIELNGMYVDWHLLEKYSNDLQKDIDKLEIEILNYFGLEKGELSLTSGNELGALLEAKGWKDHGRSKNKPTKNIVSFLEKKFKINLNRKNGVYLTGDLQLEKWKKDGYKEIVEKLIKYRELGTLMKTFIGGKVDNKNIDRDSLISTFDWGLPQEDEDKDIEKGFFQYRKNDGKIHSTFGPMMTRSHRNWSKAPNGQNIPKHGDLAKWYRKIFIPPSEDYYIVEQDAAGFQLRIGAIYSGDKEMKRVFTELGGDMHSMTAQAVLKRDVSLDKFFKLKNDGDSETKEIRFKAKAVNFGFIFGTVAYSFALGLENEWDYEDILDYVKRYQLHDRVKFFYRILKGDRINENDNESIKGNKGDFFSIIDDKKRFANIWAVAADIRKKFFERYSGLEKWIEITTKEAEKRGYVVSPFTAVRRLPQLTYQGKDDLKGKIKNWKNIALNSPVQNFESVYMNILMGEQNKYIKENLLRTALCGNVHDANISYVHKEELEEFVQISKEIFEKDRPENKGIPQELESNVADYYGKEEVWGFGTEV